MLAWIWHSSDSLYHAFDLADEYDRCATTASACGRHVTRSSETKTMGAPKCMACARALGMEIGEQAPAFPRLLEPADVTGCSYCDEAREPSRERIGVSPAGIVAPQSAIDAMRKRSR